MNIYSTHCLISKIILQYKDLRLLGKMSGSSPRAGNIQGTQNILQCQESKKVLKKNKTHIDGICHWSTEMNERVK